MACIYQASQRKADGRWDYTVSSDEEHWIHPVGYCAGTFDQVYPETPRESHLMAYAGADRYQVARQAMLPFAQHFHGDGHVMAEEAEACYARYVLDHDRRSWNDDQSQECCRLCGEWTTHRVQVGEFAFFTLCPAHDTRAACELALHLWRKEQSRASET